MASIMNSVVFPLLLTLNFVSAQICRIDLGIILDDSGSIKHWGFEEEKNFVRSVARQLHISSTNTRVAVMTFSTGPNMRIYFRDRAGQDKNSLHWALNGIRHRGGWTYTDKALDLARTRMFSEYYGSRKGAPKMLLLLTDGMSQSGTRKLSNAATSLKNNFVNIISIGVGRQIRRSELELIASRPINQHVFQVNDAWALRQIVNTVKTEACKPITCWYIECIYNEWSPWSGDCLRVRRIRTVRQEVRKSKMVVGGCAGLNIQKCQMDVETKNFGSCLKECKYVKCLWAQWSAWSASCGRSSRQRTIKAEQATTRRRSCAGLPQRCYQKPETQNRATKCNCNYVECNYGQWSQWSTTCGRGERRRNMQQIRKTTQRVDCSGLPQTCSNTPDVQTRNQKCTCNYVECKYGAWSAWSKSCGKGQRSRQMQTIRKTIQKESCNGLPTSCPSKPDVQTRTEMCQCNYVECKYGAWSAWTTSCGKGQRSRQMQAIRKTAQRENCGGLPTTCPTRPDIQTRTEMCTCNYVECQYAQWSAWTTTCGKGARRRNMQAIRKTKKAEKCDGLTQSCPTTPDIEERTKLCKCNYVECKYSEWTNWNPACGKNMERKRTLQTIKKTTEKESCSGLKQTCTGDAEQTEKKDELCECDAVRCVAQWSAWSASCGVVKRTMRFVKVPIKVKKESCDGLTTTCPDVTETQVDDLPCPKTAPPTVTQGPSAADASCNANFRAMGCFKYNKEVEQQFSRVLFSDPFKKTSTYGFSDFMFDLVCKCALATRTNKLHNFAISSKGLCIAGGDGEDSWVKHSAVEGRFCLSHRHDSCQDDDTHCIGNENTLFAYKVVA